MSTKWLFLLSFPLRVPPVGLVPVDALAATWPVGSVGSIG